MSGKFKCDKCRKKFSQKQDLKRHQNRLIDCVTGNKKSLKNLQQFGCEFCDKKFTRKDNMRRHMNNCKVKMNTITIDGDENNPIIGKKVNSIYKSENAKIINIKNLNLFVFSKDGITGLNSKDYKKILESNKHIIEELITQVNFNPDKPQHHNVYYPDLKSAYGVVYEDNKWISKKIDEILNTLLDAKIEDLNEILNDMGDFLNKHTRSKIKKAIEDANNNSIPPGSRKKLMKYIKTILYNNKDMIIKTRKLTKEQEEEILKHDCDDLENE